MNVKTPELVTEAKRLRLNNMTYRQIAAALGISSSAALCWVNDHLAEKRRTYNIAYRERQRMCRGKDRPTRRAITNEYEARVREIPPDTRTEAQRLLGEPIFERSALAQKLMQEGR